jgi:hexosaminidase
VGLLSKVLLSFNASYKLGKSSLVGEMIFSKPPPKNMYLCFTCVGDLYNGNINGATYTQDGSFYKLKANYTIDTKWVFSFTDLTYSFRNKSSYPQGIFLDYDGKYISINASVFSDYIEQEIENTSYTYENVKDYLYTFPQVNNVYNKSEKITFKNGFNINNTNLQKVDKILQKTISCHNFIDNKNGTKVEFLIDKTIKGYLLDIEKDKIKITSKDLSQQFYAIITLGNLWHFGNKTINIMSIKDYPKYEWRGILIDTARVFYSINELKKLLVYFAFFKINILHLHLSDDEAWRLESSSYPDLHKKASFRGYNLDISPQTGSSFQKYGGFYTKKDIQDLISYAKTLHIEIMAEFNVLSHANALLKSMPELIDQNDTSKYVSVQGYKQNTLNPALEFTWEFIENIIKEYSSDFSFEYIHIGFDEIPEGSWLGSPKCKAYMKKHNIKNTNDLQVYFANKLVALLKKYNKKTAFYEDVMKEKELDKESLIFIWTQDKQNCESILNKGYNIIAMPASHCYFDIRESQTFSSNGLYWIDSVSLETAYNLNPKYHKNIKGVEAALWGETLQNKDDVYKMLFPRIVAFSEASWTCNDRKDFKQFGDNLKNTFNDLK